MDGEGKMAVTLSDSLQTSSAPLAIDIALHTEWAQEELQLLTDVVTPFGAGVLLMISNPVIALIHPFPVGSEGGQAPRPALRLGGYPSAVLVVPLPPPNNAYRLETAWLISVEDGDLRIRSVVTLAVAAQDPGVSPDPRSIRWRPPPLTEASRATHVIDTVEVI